MGDGGGVRTKKRDVTREKDFVDDIGIKAFESKENGRIIKNNVHNKEKTFLWSHLLVNE